MKPVKFIRIASVAAAMALLSTTALADSQVTTQVPSMATQHFIEGAAYSNMMEIQSSARALKVSENKNIRDFAQKMADDHQNAEKQLEATLKSDGRGYEKLVPTTLNPGHMQTIARLNDESGATFDKDFLKVQRDGHDDAVKEFEKYSKNGDTPALKDFAAKMLPTLKMHQGMAKDLNASYRVDKAAAAGTIPAMVPNAAEPAAGTPAKAENNPNLDHPTTNANTMGGSGEPTTANPTEGKSSPSGGPPL